MRVTRAVLLSVPVVGVLLLGTSHVLTAQTAAPPTTKTQEPPGPAALVERLGTAVLAAGALGTAAFGIVDGLKLIPWIDLAGFERLFSRGTARRGRRWPTTIRANLDALVPALALAYGADVMEVLEAQYRSGRGKGDLPRTLRQGVRIGLGSMPAADIDALARALGLPPETARTAGEALVKTRNVRPPALGESAPAARPDVSADDRASLARLETAIDARIDAALVLAETLYVTQTKLVASLVAVGIAVGVAWLSNAPLVLGLIVGLVAIPLAPVAHDAATALQAAVKALKTVKSA